MTCPNCHKKLPSQESYRRQSSYSNLNHNNNNRQIQPYHSHSYAHNQHLQSFPTSHYNNRRNIKNNSYYNKLHQNHSYHSHNHDKAHSPHSYSNSSANSSYQDYGRMYHSDGIKSKYPGSFNQSKQVKYTNGQSYYRQGISY